MAPWPPFDQALSARPAHRPRHSAPISEVYGRRKKRGVRSSPTSEDGRSTRFDRNCPRSAAAFQSRGLTALPTIWTGTHNIASTEPNCASDDVRTTPALASLILRAPRPPPAARLTSSSKSATYYRPRTGTRARVRGKHAVVFALSATTRMMPTDHPG
ncbi:uncharacterized protein SCHCODRAFT_01245995 [Schizophyllum commune H4-8]|uniref:uncharacterized protein n=1 Tax=Schizophyllum commune (strain H4-8 / FGSC 9210) TaxID=578458 RepID=UPI002160CF4C|nr:uncharacterized protein SCHCODRAFT_01245995 [Schizophyllum commune H4-8]KAI5887197.1 hypothetical protein SCHCODRAFT_01245995 [Schizophyllum commune H4-8]